MEEEIAQANVFTEKVQRGMIDVTNEITMKEMSRATISTTPAREPPPLSIDPPSTELPTTSTDIPTSSTLPLTAGTPHPLMLSPSPLTRTSTALATRVKLPKLALKKFKGDVTKWHTFWDSFESSIHLNPELADVDKFNYLSSLVEGVVAEAISGLKLTTANYEEGIAILKERFGNKQNIITKHMEILLNIDTVTSQYNLKGLRHLYVHMTWLNHKLEA